MDAKVTPAPKAKGKTKPRAKAEKLPIPQTIQEAANYERELDGLLTALAIKRGQVDQKIQAIEAEYISLAEVTEPKIAALARAVHKYATAHRSELTGAETKTVKLLEAGVLRWYNTPSSVRIDKEMKPADIIDEMKQLELNRFIRIIEEINKEALLEEPEVANSIKGVSIVSREKFANTLSSGARIEHNPDGKLKIIQKDESSPAEGE